MNLLQICIMLSNLHAQGKPPMRVRNPHFHSFNLHARHKAFLCFFSAFASRRCFVSLVSFSFFAPEMTSYDKFPIPFLGVAFVAFCFFFAANFGELCRPWATFLAIGNRTGRRQPRRTSRTFREPTQANLSESYYSLRCPRPVRNRQRRRSREHSRPAQSPICIVRLA